MMSLATVDFSKTVLDGTGAATAGTAVAVRRAATPNAAVQEAQ
jgi:hypothetical protein